MNILVVDDEHLALESLRAKLEKIPRIDEVHAFTSPAEALAFVANTVVDVAILDISMAEMDGLTLAMRIRQLQSHTGIIFSTGYSEYTLDAFRLHADGYLLKPVDETDIERELDNLARQKLPTRPPKRIRVQCFGDFEVFVDGAPVTFGRTKSKELLAYLVDRRGAVCTSAKIANALWEDGIYDRSRQKQLSVIRNDMVKALRQVDASCILRKSADAIAVVPEMFECDYYRALSGDTAAINSFMGEYMADYSWAEFTAAAITGALSGR